MTERKMISVYVSLISPFLYGMERSVIERFEVLRPDIEPYFLLTYTIRRLRLPLLDAIVESKFDHAFLSDREGWSTLRKPRSLFELLRIVYTIVRGNIDTLRYSFGKDVFYMPSPRTPYSAFLVLIFYRLWRKPVVLGFHDTLQTPSVLLRWIRPLIPHFVFHSHYAKRAFEASNPWAINRNSPVIYNIVKYRPSASVSPLES